MSEEAKVAIGLPVLLMMSYGWYRLGSWYESKHGDGSFDEAVIFTTLMGVLAATVIGVVVMWMFCVLKSLGLLS